MKKEEYYKSYDERYKIVHQTGNLWEYFKPTKEVESFILDYASDNAKILDLGCGEGRDAIYLMKSGYFVDAIDYSKNAIKKCNELSDNLFKNHFYNLDIFNHEFTKTYDIIYSVCVLHMFVLKKHRNNFFNFIYEHLNDEGKALIIVLGDDILEKETNINDAFDLSERNITDKNIKVLIPKTSCKIVKIKELNDEIYENNFEVCKQWISHNVPGFNSTICTIIKKYTKEVK